MSLSPLLWLFTIVLLAPILSYAAADSRPFWTEKAAFIEGPDLFVVGVASNAHTLEEGRQQAFERGKVELMNYAQISSLEAQGLVLETQMTYQEVNPDKSVSVFRLLRVPADKLVAVQARLRTQTQVQEQAMEQGRREMTAIQQSLSDKQQQLERRSHQIQETFETIAQLQRTLGEKAVRVDQQQRQVEQLLQQLAAKVTVNGGQGKVTGATSTVDTLKQAETQLEEKERDLRGMFERIRNRIIDSSSNACRYIIAGMKREEVQQLNGNPDGTSYNSLFSLWYYGTSTVHFNSAGLVSSTGCVRHP